MVVQRSAAQEIQLYEAIPAGIYRVRGSSVAEELEKGSLSVRRLTPNALNDGMRNFPEFHNVYMEPGSYE